MTDARDAFRIGVDTGGTFTDVVLVDHRGRIIATHKVLSTPGDPSRAVLDGIHAILVKAKLAHDPTMPRSEQTNGERVGPQIVHGSTVATNALIEHRGGSTASIVTEGFEDTLAIARQNRPELYVLTPRRPDPPIGSDFTIGVGERIGYEGHIRKPLQDDELDRLVVRIEMMGVESVLICLLHSYANPRHEQRIADRLRARLPDLHLTVSHELLPEFREYERMATCVANAMIAPKICRYIETLAREIGGDRLRIMASSGGTLPPTSVMRRPVMMAMSGPAGGVVGAAAIAERCEQPRIITFDMGGTSTDVSLYDRAVSHTNETEIGGLPIRLPMIDIRSVGAGGGSIAWIDAGGALRVGPASAGADPGPACYDRQSQPFRATVTDAHVVLGHLGADQRLGDELKVDAAKAREAVAGIAERLALSEEDAAEGILRVCEVTMARAVRRISVERGYDPRQFALVPFGGAGGLHACRLAGQLGMSRVLLPRHPGLLSAVGMLAAPPMRQFSQSILRTVTCESGEYVDPLKNTEVRQVIDTLVDRGRAALEADGVGAAELVIDVLLDLRYVGQSYEISIAAGEGESVTDRFAAEHRRLYGYASKGRAIEVVTARVIARGPGGAITNERVAGEMDEAGDAPDRGSDCTDKTRVYGGGAWRDYLVVDRDRLSNDASIEGPAIVREYSATTLVPATWRANGIAGGHLLIERTNG